ncbi:Leucine--tRNA ligase, partial [Haemophilus influenzae]
IATIWLGCFRLTCGRGSD